MNLEIQKKTIQNAHILVLIGRIDTESAPILHAAIAGVELGEGEICVLDFDELSYISSSGLRELMLARKRFGEDAFMVVNVNETVEDIFVSTGFSEIIAYNRKLTTLDYSSMSIDAFLRSKLKGHEGIAVKPIITYKNVSYSWRLIDDLVSLIASDLRRLGVAKRSHVAICGANSANWALTFYAIQRLGAIAIPVNFNLKAGEIVELSHIGDITHFCYGQIPGVEDIDAYTAAIKENGSQITEIYDIRDSVDFIARLKEQGRVNETFNEQIEADDAALMIFTSGSTGKPKGALLSAYNVLLAAQANAAAIELTKYDKALLILPMFHIFGMVAGLLANGVADAELVIADSLHIADVIDRINEEQCTVMHSVPTVMLLIIANEAFAPGKVASLRSTILSGAAVTEAQILKLQELMPGNHFASSYGMSEMAPVSITDYNDSNEHILKTVGRPCSNVDVRISEDGEILLKGYNLMTCYYKMAIDDQSIDMDGWLHTGDLGYLDEEGYLHFEGRTKELIIRGGENISPIEVAGVISEYEGIEDVKVVGLPDDFYGEIVAAAIVPEDGTENFDTEALAAYLKERLARFKQPAFYAVYDAFPLLANGKVDMVGLKKDLIEKRL